MTETPAPDRAARPEDRRLPLPAKISYTCAGLALTAALVLLGASPAADTPTIAYAAGALGTVALIDVAATLVATFVWWVRCDLAVVRGELAEHSADMAHVASEIESGRAQLGDYLKLAATTEWVEDSLDDLRDEMRTEMGRALTEGIRAAITPPEVLPFPRRNTAPKA